jgi:hypothetical protein
MSKDDAIKIIDAACYETINKYYPIEKEIAYERVIVGLQDIIQMNHYLKFTRQNGGRQTLFNLGKDVILGELIKHIVKKKAVERVNTQAGLLKSEHELDDKNITVDETILSLSKIIFSNHGNNNIDYVETYLFDHPHLLKNVADSFVTYRYRLEKAKSLDEDYKKIDYYSGMIQSIDDYIANKNKEQAVERVR